MSLNCEQSVEHNYGHPYPTLIKPHLHQSLGVAHHDLAPNLGIETEFIERLDMRRDRCQWCIGCKYDAVCAEELDTTRQAVTASKHRGVGVELFEILQMRSLQRG